MRRIANPSRFVLSPLLRYGLAVVAAVLATAASVAFADILEPMRMLAFWSAVSVAALVGGAGPGLLCVVLSIAGAALTEFEPRWSLVIADPVDVFRLGVFIIVTSIIAVAAGLRRKAQSEAQNLRDWLGTTLSSIGDAVVATDETGKIVFVNRAAQEMSGFAASDWLDRPFDSVFRIFHEETGEPVESPVDFVLRTGNPKTLANHTALTRSDGSRMPIDDSAAPIRSEEGRLLGVVIVFRNVTVKRAADRTLKQSEHLFRNLADTAPVLIWMCDPGGHCTFVNRAWLDFTGCSSVPEAVERWTTHIHPDDLERVSNVRQALYTTLDPLEIEYRMKRCDGEYRWVLDRGLPRRDASDQLEGFTGSIVDLTERRESENARASLLEAQTAARASAEAAERRATFLAEVASILASSMDYAEALRAFGRLAVHSLADWCFVDVKSETGETERVVIAHLDSAKVRRARELTIAGQLHFGTPRVSAGATSRAEVVQAGEIPQPAAWRELGISSVATVPLIARDKLLGEITIAVEDAMISQHDVALVEEVARRAAIAIDNARLYAMALQANRAKDEFLATLSHELRTPLTAILGWAKMLRTAPLDEETQTLALETIERSARVQAELIEDLLDISRVITGKLKLDVQPTSIADVVLDVVASLRPAADAKVLSVSLDLPPETPKVIADARRLRQIVWNLVSNAIKFGRRNGNVRLKIAPADHVLRFTVADDGVGISREFLPHIFERFRQADSTATRQHGGLGLGLAIVKELVELHGGVVRAESEGENCGTTFVVDFPLDRTTNEADVVTPPVPSEILALKGRRILVVDDQEDARRVLKMMLETEGAEVAMACDAVEAMAKFMEWRPDIVVSDLAMPGEDGYSLAARIRSSAEDEGTPLIALTALADPDEGARLSKAGFNRLLRKPVTPVQLAATVTELLTSQ